MAFRGILVASFCVVLSVFASAQGGQVGGFGGGGGAGGGPITGQETVRTQILTPGDKGEWEINAEEGEVIVAVASSSVFDPAIEVVDEKGTILTSNDDIEPGVQNARVLYRFEKAGKYRVWVKGYKSAAGGQFQISLRKFGTQAVALGEKLNATMDKTGVKWFRFSVKKGDTIQASAAITSIAQVVEILGPGGESISGGKVSPVAFRAKKDGEYFAGARLRSGANANVAFRAALVHVSPLTLSAPVKRTLEEGMFDICRIEVNPGDVLRIDAVSQGPDVTISTSNFESNDDEEDTGEPTFRTIFQNEKADGHLVIVALKKTTLDFEISQSYDLGTSYQVSLSKPTKELAGSKMTSNLKVRECEFYAFAAKKGQVIQYGVSSAAFDTELWILGMDGKSISHNDDGGNGTNSSLSTLIPEDGNYLVQVGSSGSGGGGAYTLDRGEISPKVLKVGVVNEGSLKPNGSEIWSLTGKAGQTLVFSLKSTTASVSIGVTGPSGEQIGTTTQNGVTILTLPKDGSYTLWIRAQDGSGAYRLKCVDLDS